MQNDLKQLRDEKLNMETYLRWKMVSRLWAAITTTKEDRKVGLFDFRKKELQLPSLILGHFHKPYTAAKDFPSSQTMLISSFVNNL